MDLKNLYLVTATVRGFPGETHQHMVSAVLQRDAKTLFLQKLRVTLNKPDLGLSDITFSHIDRFMDAYKRRVVDNRYGSYILHGSRAKETVAKVASNAQMARIPFYMKAGGDDTYQIITHNHLAMQHALKDGSPVDDIPTIEGQVEALCTGNQVGHNNPGIMVSKAVALGLEFSYRCAPNSTHLIYLSHADHQKLAGAVAFKIPRTDIAIGA